MQEYVDDTSIELCYLPRGSPELNPTEECWRRLNQELGNRLFDTLDELRDAALATLDTIEPPSVLTCLCPLVYKNIYGVRPVTRELQNKVMWLSCGFDRPPSRDAVDRFLTDLEHDVDEVFDHLVEQTAVRGLLDLRTASIQLT